MSGDGAMVIAVVAAREHLLKRSDFLKAAKWVKHFREIGSDRKRFYLSTFPKRFRKLKPFLDITRICLNIRSTQDILNGLKPLVVIVDDKLYSKINHPRKVRKSRVKERHRRMLTLIADNLANYFRVLLKDNPERFLEELKKFDK